VEGSSGHKQAAAAQRKKLRYRRERRRSAWNQILFMALR
jgi:hypothetical protein